MLSREQIINIERKVSRDEEGVRATLHKINKGTVLSILTFNAFYTLRTLFS